MLFTVFLVTFCLQLYEQEQKCTEQLRNELCEIRRELTEKSAELDRVREAAAGSTLASSRLSSDFTAERRVDLFSFSSLQAN